MMKTGITALLIMISFLLVAGRSSGRLLMQNSLFISPDNPSTLDRNLNSLLSSESTLQNADGHVEKDAVQCDQEISPRSSSSTENATNEKESSASLSPTVQKTKKGESSESNKAGAGVFNKVTPSRPSRKINSTVTEHQLSSTSSKSPGVGHMQMIRHKSQTRKVDILKSQRSDGDDKSNNRKLGSTPSPGVGN